MGVRYPTQSSNTFVGPLPASAVETVVLVSPPLTITLDFAQILILFHLTILAGTGTTGLSARIRRGTTITGAQVNVSNFALVLAAGATGTLSGFYFDTPGAVAGQQYAITVQQSGATGAGTFNDGAVWAVAL